MKEIIQMMAMKDNKLFYMICAMSPSTCFWSACNPRPTEAKLVMWQRNLHTAAQIMEPLIHTAQLLSPENPQGAKPSASEVHSASWPLSEPHVSAFPSVKNDSSGCHVNNPSTTPKVNTLRNHCWTFSMCGPFCCHLIRLLTRDLIHMSVS